MSQAGARPSSWVQPPIAAVSLVVTLEGPVSAAGHALPDAWFGGLGGGCQTVMVGASHTSLDLKLHPLGAYAICGPGLHELGDQCLDLEEMFGERGRVLEARLREADGWEARFDLVERFLLSQAAVAASPHPLVTAAWARLCETAGTIRIGQLAHELGSSRRHLTALFGAQVGLGPKTAARLLRFARVRESVESSPDRWADIAYRYGYSDQAHLNRDFQEFAGTTPTEFLARLQSGAGVGNG